MHDCQKYREDWVSGLAPEREEEIVNCDDCRSFLQEASVILQMTDGLAQPVPEFSEEHWNGFEDRLREKLVLEKESRTSPVYWKWGALAAAAAIAVVLTWSGMRATQTVVDHPTGPAPHIEFKRDHIADLDPMVVLFLGQSEMFLRSFTKIQPSYIEDLDDARMRARQDLMEIARQKNLAGNFVPVRIALDEYESVLREIKNLDSSDDLADLQTRIHRNGLIANLKAYQPYVTLVSQR